MSGSADQPVSVTVTITNQLDATTFLAYSVEFVAQTEEEAEQRGNQFRRFQAAFTQGYIADADAS